MKSLLETVAFGLAVLALAACGGMPSTAAPVATPVAPTAVVRAATHPPPMTVLPAVTPVPSPTPIPTATSEPTGTPEPLTDTVGISPLPLDDPEALLSELSSAEQSCIAEHPDSQMLVELKDSPHLVTPDLIRCLEDATLTRLYLAKFVRVEGTLSHRSSLCIRAEFSGIDLRSIMLASSTGSGEVAALAGDLTAYFLAVSCLDEEDLEAVMGTAPGERERELESLQCLLEELGGAEGLAAAMIPTEGGEPDPAFLAANLKCRKTMPDG